MSNRYRKLAIMLLAVGMIASLVACGNEGRINSSDSENTSTVTAEPAQTDNAQNSTGGESAEVTISLSESEADMIFTHMSGRQQTREEYFADIKDGDLQYFTIGIENPVVSISDNYASVSYTSVLNANAYGARGTYRMDGIHWYEKQGENWIACNTPEQEQVRYYNPTNEWQVAFAG